ncbi:MAG TPA: hypothetical protein VN203_19050, partial [Candidatus Acidoferrum sp.]|nr:hypothetical protein [Candidatus Acidoferrum sp.]
MNSARAIARLRKAGCLSLPKLRQTQQRGLEELVRPAGFFRQKGAAIRGFIDLLDLQYRGSLRRFFARPPDQLRRELLQLKGIGPETADSILLYAGGQPFFVADAYTRRVLSRHGLVA